MKPVKFKSVLVCDPPDKGFHYISVETKIAEKFEKKGGSRRVICTLNGTESFQCALMPYHGVFYIMVNKAKRTKLGIAGGDRVTVELAPDGSKYGMPMPKELGEVLRQDRQGRKYFESLSDGVKRSLMYYIGQLKDIDKRIEASLIFIDHLNRNAGKLDRRKLGDELKRPLM